MLRQEENMSKNNINRVGVFCFYDRDGVVSKYVEYILEEIQKSITKLYIVINGNITEKGKRQLGKYSSDIYQRENMGFDGGAYADFFMKYIDYSEMGVWDEVVIFNDTFFGPFIPFTDIFSAMESEEVDFWGLRCIDVNTYKYIESYFIVFRNKIIKTGDLLYFFRTNYKYMHNATFHETCAVFERGLFGYLVNKGYTYGSYVKDTRYNAYLEADVNIIKCGLPLLKKKCLDFNRYKKSIVDTCIDYILKNTDYDVNMIYEYYMRVYGETYIYEEINYNLVSSRMSGAIPIPAYDVSEEMIVRFLESNPDIYIYGAGMRGGGLWWNYKYRIKNMKGFVVTEKDNENDYFGVPIYSVDDIPGNSNIIVALSQIDTKEVAPMILDKHNILFLYSINRAKNS